MKKRFSLKACLPSSGSNLNATGPSESSFPRLQGAMAPPAGARGPSRDSYRLAENLTKSGIIPGDSVAAGGVRLAGTQGGGGGGAGPPERQQPPAQHRIAGRQ